MGIPYRKRGINIISIALDAPQNTISALAGRVAELCRRELGVAMDLPERVVCGFFSQNRECLGSRCPYHPADSKDN